MRERHRLESGVYWVLAGVVASLAGYLVVSLVCAEPPIQLHPPLQPTPTPSGSGADEASDELNVFVSHDPLASIVTPQPTPTRRVLPTPTPTRRPVAEWEIIGFLGDEVVTVQSKDGGLGHLKIGDEYSSGVVLQAIYSERGCIQVQFQEAGATYSKWLFKDRFQDKVARDVQGITPLGVHYEQLDFDGRSQLKLRGRMPRGKDFDLFLRTLGTLNMVRKVDVVSSPWRRVDTIPMREFDLVCHLAN
jgi:hypothetical protein